MKLKFYFSDEEISRKILPRIFFTISVSNKLYCFGEEQGRKFYLDYKKNINIFRI